MPVAGRRSVFADDPEPPARRVLGGEPMWTPIEPAPRDATCELSPASEAALIAALDAPLAPAPSADLAYAEKEHELLALVARLSPIEALALARRLAIGRASDPIVTRLRQFAPARRARIHAFITDPKARVARAARR
jgi:hypothetical protein